MKVYSVYLAPAIRDSQNKIVPNGAKHWERQGTIESKNKKTALKFLKENCPIPKALKGDYVFVLLKPTI